MTLCLSLGNAFHGEVQPGLCCVYAFLGRLHLPDLGLLWVGEMFCSLGDYDCLAEFVLVVLSSRSNEINLGF